MLKLCVLCHHLGALHDQKEIKSFDNLPIFVDVSQVKHFNCIDN